MHKNRLLILGLIAITGMSSLTACGKKQEAVLIQAQDSGRDTTTGEIVKGDSAASLKEEAEAKDNSTQNEIDRETQNFKDTVDGVWLKVADSSIVIFDNGYFNNSATYETGVYETDNKSYINIQAQKINNDTEDIDGVEEVVTTYEDTEYKFKIVELTESKMILELDGNKTEYSKLQQVEEREETEVNTEESENTTTQTLNDGQSFTIVTENTDTEE